MVSQSDERDALIGLIVGGWVGLRTGTLPDTERELLDRERPGWRDEAAQLIAEGVLAYATVEMVQPDLAYAGQLDPHGRLPSPEEIAARLTAHMLDFIDYRHEVEDTAQSAGAGES
jgi:hypothetical protein